MPRIPRGLMQSPIFLALLSTAASLGVSTGDSLITNHIFKPVSSISLVSSLSYLTIGGALGSLFFLAFGYLDGRRATTSESMFDFQGKGRQFHMIAAWNGCVGAALTGMNLYGYRTRDMGTVIALSSSSLLFVILYDHFVRRSMKLQNYILEVGLLIAGVGLTSYNPGSFSTMMSGIAVLVVLRGIGKGYASEIAKDGTEILGARIFTVWNFIYLAVFGVALSAAIVTSLGYTHEYTETLRRVLFHSYFVGAVFFVMLCAYYSNLWSNESKDLSSGVTTYEIVASMVVPLSFVTTFIGNHFFTDIFGEFPTEPKIVMVRTLGVVLITLGVMRYAYKKGREKQI